MKKHYNGRVLMGIPGLQYPTSQGPVHTPENNRDTSPCIQLQMLCNFTNSVQISLIQTLKLIAFSWTIHWCWWLNVLMINEKKNDCELVEWADILQRSLSVNTSECVCMCVCVTDANTDRGKQPISAVRVSRGAMQCSPYLGVCIHTQFEPYQELKI